MIDQNEKLLIEGSRVKVLTQARQIDAAREHGVVVDYLRFTLRTDQLHTGNFIPVDANDQDVARLMALKFSMLLGFTLGMDRPGRDYYEFTTTIDNDLGHEVASVSAGGEGQRGTVCFTLKGEGCTNAAKGWEQRVHAFFGPVNPKLTRIDLARDFYEGEVTIDEVVGGYAAHAFSYRNRYPSYTQYGCWMNFALDAEAASAPLKLGPVTLLHGHSRTFQVGRRESGKVFRAYEKGHQYKLMDSRWLRCEVELRSVNRVIPWDALIQPGGYYAGAYEFCMSVVNHEVPVRVPTATKTAECGVQSAVNWIKRVVAPTLVVISSAMPDFEWLEDLVLDQLHRRVPRALRGFNHHTIQLGLQKAFAAIKPENLNVCAPAAVIA